MSEAAVHDTIRKIIEATTWSSFMKGTAKFPQCGFSAQVAKILDHLGVPFKDVNVLDDSGLRDGIKSFTNWPPVGRAPSALSLRRRWRPAPRSSPAYAERRTSARPHRLVHAHGGGRRRRRRDSSGSWTAPSPPSLRKIEPACLRGCCSASTGRRPPRSPPHERSHPPPPAPWAGRRPPAPQPSSRSRRPACCRRSLGIRMTRP